MTKRMQDNFNKWFTAFLRYRDRTIYQVYKIPSDRKISIWEAYRNKMCPTVLSFCCQSFVVGYLEKENDKLMFCVDTYGGCHRFELKADEIVALMELKIYGV